MPKESRAIMRRGSFAIAAVVTGLVLFMLVPIAVRSGEMQQSLPEGWQDLLNETFETGIGPEWIVTDTSTTDGGEYMWGVETYPGPTSAVWAVGGGADGGSLDPTTDQYPDNVDSWLIYGPLDLSRVFQADLYFDWWLDSASGDWFRWCALTDPSDLDNACDGPGIAGPIGTWISGTLSLDDYALTTTPLYIAFNFTSNGDGQGGKGVFVDNVVVRGDYGYHVYLPLIRRDPTPTPVGYMDTFSGPTTWEVVAHTGDDGPPGTDWFDVRNESGYLKMWVNDRWEHIVASPRVVSTDSPFEIQANVYFYQRSWSSGYAFVFGSSDQQFNGRYYRILAVYTQDGQMNLQIKRMYGRDTTEAVILDWVDIPLSVLDGRTWNRWRIVRDGSHIIIFINDKEMYDVTDDAITGKGYFGMFLSTWEFKPVEIWVDYFNVMPH